MHAKANPGKMNYASAGAGSAAHLNGERFRLATSTQMQHIPYKGGPEGLTAVMTGECDFYFIPLPAARGLVQGGKLSILAVSGSARSAALPDTPTTVEAGFPNSDYNFWVGFFAPGEDAEGDRRQAQRRDDQGAGKSGGEAEARQHRRRSDADEARRVRRLRAARRSTSTRRW